ncbi:MAG TPA: TlpA disulfide reductase family protein [Solirubrobacterales bacterium]|nr:TlpA disulfide reductase family protein [Solirubrobacterales bacterium]
MSEPAEGRGAGQGAEGPEGSTVAGRRTLGPAPKPGSRYSYVVGLLFLALIVVAFFGSVVDRDEGTLGLDEETSDLPLPEFAVPLATSSLEGDANVAQDDCETSQIPCPAGDVRTPACEVGEPGAIRVCDFFDRPFVLSFWFSRGGDCEAQQDVVSAAYERYRGRVGFLSLNVRDSRDTVRDMVRQRGWRMPVGHDGDGAVANLYRVGGCPTFVFAYPGGLLEHATIGELDGAQLAAEVRRLLRATRAKAAERD